MDERERVAFLEAAAPDAPAAIDVLALAVPAAHSFSPALMASTAARVRSPRETSAPASNGLRAAELPPLHPVAQSGSAFSAFSRWKADVLALLRDGADALEPEPGKVVGGLFVQQSAEAPKRGNQRGLVGQVIALRKSFHGCPTPGVLDRVAPLDPLRAADCGSRQAAGKRQASSAGTRRSAANACKSSSRNASGPLIQPDPRSSPAFAFSRTQRSDRPSAFDTSAIVSKLHCSSRCDSVVSDRSCEPFDDLFGYRGRHLLHQQI